MPRRNQNGLMIGRQGRGHRTCQGMGRGYGKGSCRTPHERIEKPCNIYTTPEEIEFRAERLKTHAANLRNLASQLRKP